MSPGFNEFTGSYFLIAYLVVSPQEFNPLWPGIWCIIWNYNFIDNTYSVFRSSWWFLFPELICCCFLHICQIGHTYLVMTGMFSFINCSSNTGSCFIDIERTKLAYESYETQTYTLNTLRQRKVFRHFLKDIFKCIFLYENV